MTEEKRILAGNAPVTTGITSDGKILAATLNGENALAIVDIETGNVEKVPVGSGPATGIY
jgi:DNA-binding beta-propeller fold protein YncE